ncbi:MAG: FAD-dependent oxidoreductase, partial [Candidatus Levyibacteriota bacterium]
PMDNMGTGRSFTISSSPLDETFLAITIKIPKPSTDFKKALFSLKKGSMINFYGPLGGFFLREDDKTPRVFLAGGIGITPFYSMIRYVSQKKLHIPIILFATFSTEEEVIFYKELKKIARKNKNIQIIFAVSKTTTSWKGDSGRLSKAHLKKYIDDFSKPIFSIAGPPKMVEEIIDLLLSIGVEEDRIKAEDFTGY